MPHNDQSIGANIKRLRKGLYTQAELAAAADVSPDLIRKLEQERRHTASVPSLHRIAKALDVDLGELLSKGHPMPSSDPDAGVVAIRRALTPVDDLLPADHLDQEPLDIVNAERTVDYLWGSYWAGRYELLASLLPSELPKLRATFRAVRSADRPQAATCLARAYQAAGDTLVHLGHTDAAWLAIREALSAAQHGDEELLDRALRVSVSWQLLVQGRVDEAERIAVAAADGLQPTGESTPSEVAAYGTLTVTAATAAARARKASSADELLNEARGAADILGHERSDHQTTFGPAKVAMLSVDCAVVQDNFPEALAAARHLSREADLPLATRARHLADVAYCNLRLGRDETALNTLLTMEHTAPDWIRYQTLPRQITRELIENERRRNLRLHELALRLGVHHTN